MTKNNNLSKAARTAVTRAATKDKPPKVARKAVAGAAKSKPPKPTRAAASDQLQIDIGTFIIRQQDTQVGELYVTVNPDYPNNEMLRVEHWCLYSTFVSPSSEATNTSLQFLYAAGQDPSLEDFLDRIREIEGARYIQAKCEEQSLS